MTRMLLAFTVLAALAAVGCHRHDEAPIAAEARASTHDSELSSPRPILHVRNFAASVAYYRDALGFKLQWDHGSPPDFGAVSRGDAVLFLCEACTSSRGAWNMIFARNVDKLHDELRQRRAIIRQPPTNMPWHMREMQVSDPDGNVIRFGTGLPEE
jgi:catechol 2,3-dioxygenase-like lactoylglutathione lyase family enzyme